jgi:hypothetical protein
VVNAPERVEVSKKTTQTPSVVKWGRVATTKRDNAPNNHPRKKKTRPLQKAVNVSQPVVDRHLVDNNIPQSSTQTCYINENARMSENPDDLVLGKHEISKGIQEISTNYTSFKEVYDCGTTIVNPCFSTIIAKNVIADPDSNTMAECKRHSDWNK